MFTVREAFALCSWKVRSVTAPDELLIDYLGNH